MKKLFLVLLFFLAIAPCQVRAIQEDGKSYSQFECSGTTKVYNSKGSLQNYYTSQSNGSVKVYDKYHRYEGKVRKQGGKVKYYPKK